jgi:siderophore-iron reductase FhuF
VDINIILPPTLLCDLLLQLRLPLPLAHTAFIIADDARVAAVKIGAPPDDVATADPFDRFGHLIFDHFEPLIELWSVRSDVTRRVLWTNVGNTFEAMLTKVEAVSGQKDRLDAARWVINQRSWKDGRPNPLFGAVHYVRRGDANIRLSERPLHCYTRPRRPRGSRRANFYRSTTLVPPDPLDWAANRRHHSGQFYLRVCDALSHGGRA